MRTYVYLDQRRWNIDSIDTYSHVVVAALNKEPLIPRGRAMTPKQIQALPQEERATVMDELKAFAQKETGGAFAVRPARWAASAEEAATMAATLAAEKVGEVPKYTGIAVMPVAGVI